MVTIELIDKGIQNFREKSSRNPNKSRSIGINNDIENKMRNALILIANKINGNLPKGTGYNSNILIISDNAEYADEIGFGLKTIIENWYDSAETINIPSVTEKEFLKLKNKQLEVPVVLVRGFCGEKLDKIYNKLNENENGGNNCSVIFCTTSDVVGRIRDYDRDDYKLYHYLLGNRYNVALAEEENAFNIIITRLTSDGMMVDESFKNALNNYISAVYSDAVLEKREFADDLIRRVYREHYRTLSPGTILTEKDVPFSKKAENRKAAKFNTNDIVEEKYNSNNDDKETINKLEIKKPSTNELENDQIEEKLNILVTNVSFAKIKKDKIDKNRYVDVDGNEFIGGMTNEAPIKSISHRLGRNGKYLDAILFIESETVRNNHFMLDGEEYSHIDYLKKNVRNFLGEYVDKTKFVDIKISDEPTENDVADTVFQIYNHLLQWASEKKQLNIYIESNGGVRYVLTMLLSLTKTLENYYDNVHISEITSMILQKQPTRIINTKGVFDTAQITGIADEFVNYGRINSLQRYFEEHKKDLNQEQVEDVQRVLSKLKKLSDDIQLCRTYMMLEDLYGESNLKDVIDTFTRKYSGKENALISILRHILQLILDEMAKTVYRYIDCKKVPILFLPDTIEWCINKSYIQQALTFCSEQLSNYLVESGKMRLSAELQDVLNEKDTKDYDKNYYFLAHLNEFNEEIKKCEINRVINTIRSNCELKMLSGNDWETMIKKSDSPIIEADDETKEIAQSIQNVIIKCFLKNSDLSDSFLESVFKENGFNVDILNIDVPVSNQIKSPLKLTMRGQYVDKNGEIRNHENLAKNNKIIIKILPVIIRSAIDSNNERHITESIRLYEKIIDEMFSDMPEIAEKLKEMYSSKQSKKYNLEEALATGFITSNLSSDCIQKIVYIYSLCKEQRNITNHAQDSYLETNVIMNTLQLKKLMKSLIEELRRSEESSYE